MRKRFYHERVCSCAPKEGMVFLTAKGQDFFYYWEDYDPTLQDLYFVIDDWS